MEKSYEPTSNSANVLPATVLPQYVETQCPPPSYEEVMGHQILTTAKTDTPQAQMPPLSYVDIMPRCLNPGNITQKMCPTFDKFSVLIEAANQWLTANTGFTVWKCETVERKVTAGPMGQIIIEMDKMIFSDSTFGFNVYIRGLRMWLRKKEPNEAVQRLGLLDVVPDKVCVQPVLHGVHPFGMGYYVMQHHRHIYNFLTFEGLTETIQKLNSKLRDQPLPGTILSVETSSHKTVEGYRFNDMDLDPDKTCRHEDGTKMKRFTQVIRVFYVIGEPAHEEIGMTDFVPAVTRPGDVLRPTQFESWAQLMTRTFTWIPQQQGIRIVSLQTCTIKYQESLGGPKIFSDSTDDFEMVGNMSSKAIKVMRVFHVKRNGDTTPALRHQLSCRTFLPVRLGKSQFETMPQTMFRIEAWLRVTGMPVYNVETCQCYFNEYKASGVEDQKSYYTNMSGFGSNKYVTAISVYFPYQFQEPNPAYLPPAPVYDLNYNNSASCEIL